MFYFTEVIIEIVSNIEINPFYTLIKFHPKTIDLS